MHRLVPDFIIQRCAAGQMSGRFSAVSLFVDISGFSAITDALMAYGQHGSEVLATLMTAVFEPLVQSVYEQDGFIATFAGDAFTALFPLDDAHPQGRQRALAAAWRIQERMATMAEQATPYGTFALAAKEGVATGDVDWGIVSAENGSRAVYYIRGTAIDECAAAEHLANPGDIVLTPNLYTAVQRWVSAELVPNTEGLNDHYLLTAISAELPVPGPVDLPAADPDIMARFYPRALVTRSDSGEFRHVISMFISLPTVRTEAQLSIFMQSLFALQDQYGGLFNRLDFGDKGSYLLLFWGAPVAYETDVERALNFILDLQTRTSIPISAGVTYRIAHAGYIGSPLRDEYTCFGSGVNLAARFMTTASRGEIWLGEEMARRAERHFDLESEGAMAFKGFAEKQQVYVLYERKEKVEAIFQGELVGREADLAQLADFVAPLWEGRYAGVMVVWGEPGIGKSRLVHDFQRELSSDSEGSGVRWFLCQADEILRESLNPIRYWLRRYFGQTEAQTEARNKRDFNRTLDRLIGVTEDEALAGELDRTRSFLAALLGLHWPDSLYEQLDPQGRYDNTLIGLISLVQAESFRGPVVIHLEDAHRLDEDSKTFLARLARTLTADELKAYPVAVVVTARPAGSESLLGEGFAYREIDLSRLADDSLARLAQGQLGGPAAPALQDFLAERSEGNPFFAEQVLRYLQQGGFLTQREAGWDLMGETQASLLPTDVRALLVARLDQLAEEVKEVVQTAAVLGREFEVQLLSRMLQGDEALPQKVADAEHAAIWSALSQLRYQFNHALLRDAAYRMQLRARRKALHMLAVDALESLSADDPSPHFSLLAYHAEQAGLEDRARNYLRKAGDVARAAYQNTQAIDYYARALALTPEGDALPSYDLLLARAEAYGLLGDRTAQFEDLQALEKLAEAIGDDGKRAEVALSRAKVAEDTGDYPGAIAAAKQALTLAEVAGKRGKEAQAYLTWGRALWRQGDYDTASRQVTRALELARAAGLPRITGVSLRTLGILAKEQQDTATARNRYEQALTIARQTGDRRNEGYALFNLGVLAAENEGDYALARDHFEQFLANAREIGDRWAEGYAFNGLGAVADYRADYAAARGYYEQSLTVARETGDRSAESLALGNLGLATAAQGDYAAALVHSRQALSIAREVGYRQGEGFALTKLGNALEGLGQFSEAAAAYDEAISLYAELDLPHLDIASKAGLARVYLALSAQAERRAKSELAKARKIVDGILAFLDAGNTLHGTEAPLRTYLTCVQVLDATGDRRADEILETAHALLQEQANKIPDAADQRNFLANAPWHSDILAAYARLSTKR